MELPPPAENVLSIGLLKVITNLNITIPLIHLIVTTNGDNQEIVIAWKMEELKFVKGKASRIMQVWQSFINRSV